MAKFVKELIVLFAAISIIAQASALWAGQTERPLATASGYFDIKTGHKYIQNSNGSYTEFSRTGKLLRQDVPNTMPLLVSKKFVHPIEVSHLMVYKKRVSGTVQHLVLPASQPHPENWRCRAMVISGKQHLKSNSIGKQGPVQNGPCNDGNSAATKAAYFDVATGHRYQQNSDGTYNEFSRKGALLKSGIPCTATVLTKGPYVRELNDTDYVVYEKYQAGKPVRKIVSAARNHPDGWISRDVLAAAH